jgi:hypothetical protein
MRARVAGPPRDSLPAAVTLRGWPGQRVRRSLYRGPCVRAGCRGEARARSASAAQRGAPGRPGVPRGQRWRQAGKDDGSAQGVLGGWLKAVGGAPTLLPPPLGAKEGARYQDGRQCSTQQRGVSSSLTSMGWQQGAGASAQNNGCQHYLKRRRRSKMTRQTPAPRRGGAAPPQRQAPL